MPFKPLHNINNSNNSNNRNNKNKKSYLMNNNVKKKKVQEINKKKQDDLEKSIFEQGIKIRGRWGRPCWIFFHTLAEFINEEYYLKNYKYIFEIIKEIMYQIPCPFCRSHALYKIRITKMNEIDNKEKLKIYFLNFHNEVNRQNKQTVHSNLILDKYKNFNLMNSYKNFLKLFYTSYYAGSGLGNAYTRNKSKSKVTTFFNKNWNLMFK